MELKRFFALPSDVLGNEVLISGDEAEHLTKVLRLRVGFSIIVSCGDGKDLYCTITKISNSTVLAKIDEIKDNDSRTKIPVKLFFALPKGDKIDLIAQKATELGVSEIYPFKSSFVSEEKYRKDRLETIVEQACKQCGRSIKPKLGDDLLEFGEAMKLAASEGVSLCAYERESEQSLKCIRQMKNPSALSLIVGSEGGFSTEEIETIRKLGIKTCTLGKRILRCETACIAFLSIAMYELGEMD